MSSNIIKAFAISYDKETCKKLDFKEREERIFDKAVQLSREQFPDQEFPADGFTAGLNAESIPEEAIPEDDFTTISASDMEDFRNSVREEVIDGLREEIYAQARQELEEERQNLYAQIQAEAEAVKAEAIEQAKAEAEIAKQSIIQIASSQGYEDGLNRAKDEEAEIVAKLENEREHLKEEYNRQVLELEPAFVEILKEYVRKISGVVLNNHTEVLTYLMDCGINKAPKDTEFTIKLNPEDYDRMSVSFSDISLKYEDKLSLQFEVDQDLPRGEVKLENKERVLHCGLGATMEGLLDSLDLISE